MLPWNKCGGWFLLCWLVCLSTMAESVEEQVRRHVAVLAGPDYAGREYGSGYDEKTAKYLMTSLEAMGYVPTLQEIPADVYPNAGRGWNVMAVLPGSVPILSQKYIVYAAHLDHIGYLETQQGRVYHPGANDNASGVAVVLALARRFKENPQKPKHAVVFLFFDGEEKGFYGSRYWTAHPTVPLKDLLFVLDFDMCGVFDKEKNVYVFGTRTGDGFRDMLQQFPSNGLKIRYPWEVLLLSDHAPFVQCGVPGALVVTGMTKTYHTPQDTPEKLDYKSLTELVDWAYRGGLSLENPRVLFRREWRADTHAPADSYEGFKFSEP